MREYNKYYKGREGGKIIPGVPHRVVRDESLHSTAKPKSAILIFASSSSDVSRRFSGFRSLKGLIDRFHRFMMFNDIILLLYCIVLYCIVLYCIVLYCIVLYCVMLYFFCRFNVALFHFARFKYVCMKGSEIHEVNLQSTVN